MQTAIMYIVAPQWKHVSCKCCTAAEVTFPWFFFFLVGERRDTK